MPSCSLFNCIPFSKQVYNTILHAAKDAFIFMPKGDGKMMYLWSGWIAVNLFF